MPCASLKVIELTYENATELVRRDRTTAEKVLFNNESIIEWCEQ